MARRRRTLTEILELNEILEETCEALYALWWRYAYSRLRRAEDAEDAVQDAIERTLSAAPPVETRDEAGRYVWTVLRQTSVPRAIAAKTKIRTETFAADGPADRDTDSSPLDLCLMAEDRKEWNRKVKRAEEALAELPERYRVCVELNIVREPPLTLREIAKLLDIGKSTVGDRIQRGIEILADAMGEGDDR